MLVRLIDGAVVDVVLIRDASAMVNGFLRPSSFEESFTGFHVRFRG
jgi:hypothetical protein